MERHNSPVPLVAAYRPDIDGLRAIAACAVLLFHAEVGPSTGGFVGVDVFFVISGYLITQLVARAAEKGRFSLLNFYERRVRRLLPAMIVMLIVTTAAAAVLFLPIDFKSFGRNAIGAGLFASNVFLWTQSDYFDGPAELKPLLHTWSLAVEEQFYILYPILLVWLIRRGRPRTIAILAALAGVSLLSSVIVVAAAPSAAFYLAPFRAWELLIGGLLALGAVPPIKNSRVRAAAGAAGLAMIGAAVVLYSAMTPFPGLSALLPCLGAALIIQSGSEGPSPVTTLLSWRPVVFVGLISYSLYLWHWPLIVFVDYYLIEPRTSGQTLALLTASFLLAVLSRRFVEQPFRHAAGDKQSPVLLGKSLVAMLAMTLVGTCIYLANGWPGRFPTQVNRIASYAFSANPESDMCGDITLQLQPGSPCTIGEPTEASLFLWGDSHAAALYGALADIAVSGRAAVYGATPLCPPLLGLGTSEECLQSNNRRLAYVFAHPEIETVVLAARWSLYFRGRAVRYGPAETNGNLPSLVDAQGHRFDQFTPEAVDAFQSGLEALVSALVEKEKRVVLVYPIPETGYDVPSTAARLAAVRQGDPELGISLRAYNRRHRDALAILDGLGSHPFIERVYPTKVLCSGRRCLMTDEGVPLYFDSHHLSIPGARLLLPQLQKAIASQNDGSMIRSPSSRN